MTLFEEVLNAVEETREQGTILLEIAESVDVLQCMKQVFTNGSHAVMWQSFSKEIKFIETDNDDAIQEAINDLFGDDDFVYLIIEDDEYYVIKIRPNEIVSFLSECRYVIYYISDFKFRKLLCENDHNQVMCVWS